MHGAGDYSANNKDRTMMQLREATQADLEYMADHSISRGQKEFPVSIDIISCLEHEGVILYVGGVKLMTPTVAWCWMDLSVESMEHLYSGYRILTEWLGKIIETHKLIRLMAAVECNFPQAIRTIEHLGFERESIMKNWVDGRPAFLYVRLTE